MKRISIALALMFAVGTVQAADTGNWKSWYNNMLKGLKSKVQKKMESKQRVTAVAAVRGAKQGDDPQALYWKGGVSEKAQKKLADEQKQLTEAVELVVNGDVEGGRAAIEKFLKDNPESFFVQDAKDALANLPAAEAKPEEEKKEEAPAEGEKEEAPAKSEKTEKAGK